MNTHQIITRLYENSSSRAASTRVQKDTRVTEMINGILVSKAASSNEPVVIDLQEYAKSRKGLSSNASVQGINKLKEIQEFFNSNGRI